MKKVKCTRFPGCYTTQCHDSFISLLKFWHNRSQQKLFCCWLVYTEIDRICFRRKKHVSSLLLANHSWLYHKVFCVSLLSHLVMFFWVHKKIQTSIMESWRNSWHILLIIEFERFNSSSLFKYAWKIASNGISVFTA